MAELVWAKAEPLYPHHLNKTRQRGVTDAGTTVPLSPHLQCRNSDDNIYFIQLKTLIDQNVYQNVK